MANTTDKHDVRVLVYDLSQGMAPVLSQSMLGKRLDGIWHTSVVVYGAEIFFGSGGIQEAVPGTTAAGSPTSVLDYGHTEVPAWLFQQFLQGSQPQFRGEAYHLLRNNCNHFTNHAVSFLVGRSLSEHILNLPGEFLSTPLGAVLAPMLDSFFAGVGTGTPTALSE